ncbi:hypothetical protein ACGFYU_30840 [Streptomyces sp. NPDC048337]|uniref:hypothetical protein n=1 Tax=Streptomyces sp. NPDC048337 TaxID=3365535 RepID=UPI003713D1CB
MTSRHNRGWPQWVLGVPLALVYVLAALFFLNTLTLDGPREDIATSTHAVTLLSAIALLITLAPALRRTLGRWWYAVPLLLTAVAFIRLATV